MADREYGPSDWPPTSEAGEPPHAGFRPPRTTPPRTTPPRNPLADRTPRHIAPAADHHPARDPKPREFPPPGATPRRDAMHPRTAPPDPVPWPDYQPDPMPDPARWHATPPPAALRRDPPPAPVPRHAEPPVPVPRRGEPPLTMPRHGEPPRTAPRHGEPPVRHVGGGRHSTGEWHTVGDRRPPGRPARTRRPDASRWHWLLLLPIAVPLLPVLYNRVEPTLLGIPFFYWGQLSFAFLASVVIAVVHRKAR
jgi:hypothetical protein